MNKPLIVTGFEDLKSEEMVRVAEGLRARAAKLLELDAEVLRSVARDHKDTIANLWDEGEGAGSEVLKTIADELGL